MSCDMRCAEPHESFRSNHSLHRTRRRACIRGGNLRMTHRRILLHRHPCENHATQALNVKWPAGAVHKVSYAKANGRCRLLPLRRRGARRGSGGIRRLCGGGGGGGGAALCLLFPLLAPRKCHRATMVSLRVKFAYDCLSRCAENEFGFHLSVRTRVRGGERVDGSHDLLEVLQFRFVHHVAFVEQHNIRALDLLDKQVDDAPLPASALRLVSSEVRPVSDDVSALVLLQERGRVDDGDERVERDEVHDWVVVRDGVVEFVSDRLRFRDAARFHDDAVVPLSSPCAEREQPVYAVE
mmetsp:Transcript_2902/g.7896  ORF Transcript_2902/g.7896 Transcript_2902/m.7896 type:complete len:296 (-) Transcript_2902:340-1227(-)